MLPSYYYGIVIATSTPDCWCENIHQCCARCNHIDNHTNKKTCHIYASPQLHHVWREDLDALLQEGFVPVLHGDGVFDKSLGCTVLRYCLGWLFLAAESRRAAAVVMAGPDEC